MKEAPTYEALQERVAVLETRVRKLSEEKANLYLILHMVELLNPIAGVDGLLESLMAALCGSLGGTNVEIYYLEEGDIHYANLFGERRVIDQISDELVAQVFRQQQFVEQPTDSSHTLLANDARPVACHWIMPLLVGSELIGVIKMSDLLGSAQMRDYLKPFFSHMALILSNEIKTRIAEAANKAKSNFLATMSHEIRTPLNGILGMAQLLAMPECSPDKHRECARTILSSGQTLLTLLNDVLDLSKVEANKLELIYSIAQPQQILDQVMALFAESAKQKNLRIEAAWLGPARQSYQMDLLRVRQMLSNLVNNAIKFSDQGLVRLEARELARHARHAELEFAVVDNGIGIAFEQQCRLFKPFTQVDVGSTRRYGGSGLGLSIVQRFAELMDGEAGVDSVPGQGARFWFRIRCLPIEDYGHHENMEKAEAIMVAGIDAGEPQQTPRPVDGGAAVLATPEKPVARFSQPEKKLLRENPEMLALLDELDRLLAKHLFGAISQFQSLENRLASYGVVSHFAQLGQLIGEMQFDQARSELNLLRADLGRQDDA